MPLMESLKVPKGSASKTSVPVAIRFNANEESIEDVTKSCDSLSSSPIHGNSEDSSWRKDFLQGTFFGRKRSGSSENVATTTVNEVEPVGTWKLFKGRVSQAMEDIKSSKQDASRTDVNGDDSDADSATINSSISEDFSEAVAFHSPPSRVMNTDSDSDTGADSETFLISEPDSGKSRKSQNKKISRADAILSKIRKTKEDFRPHGKSLLRRRHKGSPKDIEIESAVEITEEMSLSTAAENTKIDEDDNTEKEVVRDSEATTVNDITTLPPPKIEESKAKTKSLLEHAFNHRGIVFAVIAIFSCWAFKIPPFIQGILTCLCSMIMFGKFCKLVGSFINKFLSKIFSREDSNSDSCSPQRDTFVIPNYDKMPPCAVPAGDERKQLKNYSGWMNEINNYDPTNYHISMTRSVFVRLDGTKLSISSTNARIPKRSSWNEQPIDIKSITFTKRNCYDLVGAHVEMCPKGLARKRYFSRKYPIQLIIKNVSSNNSNSDTLQDEGKSTEMENSPTEERTTDLNLTHQSSNESATNEKSFNTDFGSIILHSDLQVLQDQLDASEPNTELTSVPCGDDIRVLLFARSDREKEDWFRRFAAATVGAVIDHELQFPDMVFVNEDDVMKAVALDIQERDSIDLMDDREGSSNAKLPMTLEVDSEHGRKGSRSDSLYEGLLLSSSAARGPADYVKFMTIFQKACSLKSIPVIRPYPSESPNKKNRRERKQEDELWKGIDQSLYLGPSGSVVWANVLVGRIIFSCLNDSQLLGNIQEFLQKKLSSIRLPNFMEEVQIAQVDLGDTPPLIHRVSQPLLDERGTWVDADVTYEGLMHMTITTKLNLLRLKRQQHHSIDNASKHSPTLAVSSMPEKYYTSGDAIYDSNAESSGASSSESESPTQTNAEHIAEQQSFSQGSSKKFLRIVDRITASNLFQSAAEIPYIQKAMENMNTKIRLRVELKGLVARCIINIPPPPSDRIWLGFRGPPRLWISAKPALGDHTVDWSIVTNAIESKLCDEVTKYLVYPNMVDLIAPFLGHSTYRESSVS
ncbi:Testis-expressed protein 2 [Pseudolycoriella hygida]|uniref:Testis-expressed protein 2 n=1 Tax=Pseudolycoriella hygida TaxID=35572 RepID=A0A9Q0N684_9DIPT|nr:Testis-expressed protein 2 [Pseudolycoriella hygida]